MDQKTKAEPFMPLVEEFKLARPKTVSPLAWGVPTQVVHRLLAVGCRSGYGADDLYGLLDPKFVHAVRHASSNQWATTIDSVWAKVMKHYKENHDIHLPDVRQGKRRGRPVRYTRDFFSATEVLARENLHLKRLCRLRWCDIDDTPEAYVIHLAQFDTIVLAKTPQVVDAMELLLSWSARLHHCGVDRLKSIIAMPNDNPAKRSKDRPIVPSSNNPLFCADPRTIYTAKMRFDSGRDTLEIPLESEEDYAPVDEDDQ